MTAVNNIVKNSGTLTVDASNNKKITATGWNFAGYGGWIHITGGTGWTPGSYTVVSRTGTKIKLNSSPAAVNTAGGHWQLLSGAHGDCYQIVDQTTVNTLLYGLYYPNNHIFGGQGITGGSLAASTTDYAAVACDIQCDETVLEWSSPLINFYCKNTKLQGTNALFAPSPEGNYVGQDVVFEDLDLFDEDGTPVNPAYLASFSGVTVRTT